MGVEDRGKGERERRELRVHGTWRVEGGRKRERDDGAWE